MNTAKRGAAHDLTQYELSTQIITKLNTFKLTPTAKLVLLYLTTCYNPKHKEVFPKQKTIAEKLGISEVSVTRAISELHKEGLVISERKYTNRYKFTSRIVSECGIKLIDDKIQIDREENIKLICHEHEQKKETKKEQLNQVESGKLKVENEAGNINSLDFDKIRILKQYAQKHYKTTPENYLKWLLNNKDVQDKIICEYKMQKKVTQRALRSSEDTQALIKSFKEMKENTCTAESCGLSLADILKKHNNLKITF